MRHYQESMPQMIVFVSFVMPLYKHGQIILTSLLANCTCKKQLETMLYESLQIYNNIQK